MKTLLVVLSIIAAPLLFASPVFAQMNPFDTVCEEGVTHGEDVAEPAAVCVTDGSDPISGSEGVIIRVVRLLGWVVGFVAVLMIVVAGLKYVTANGDANSIKSARDTIIYALIGVVVFAMSQLIVRFMVSRL